MSDTPCNDCPFVHGIERARRSIGADLLDMRAAIAQLNEIMALAERSYGKLGTASRKLSTRGTDDTLDAT